MFVFLSKKGPVCEKQDKICFLLLYILKTYLKKITDPDNNYPCQLNIFPYIDA